MTRTSQLRQVRPATPVRGAASTGAAAAAADPVTAGAAEEAAPPVPEAPTMGPPAAEAMPRHTGPGQEIEAVTEEEEEEEEPAPAGAAADLQVRAGGLGCDAASWVGCM
jgi:hypothetical protein